MVCGAHGQREARPCTARCLERNQDLLVGEMYHVKFE